jgi:hypothetical protein
MAGRHADHCASVEFLGRRCDGSYEQVGLRGGEFVAVAKE